jgi:hypothetical protein
MPISYDNWVLEIARRATVETGSGPGATTSVSQILTEQALRDWASSRTATTSLLGISVSVDIRTIRRTRSRLVPPFHEQQTGTTGLRRVRGVLGPALRLLLAVQSVRACHGSHPRGVLRQAEAGDAVELLHEARGNRMSR